MTSLSGVGLCFLMVQIVGRELSPNKSKPIPMVEVARLRLGDRESERIGAISCCGRRGGS